MQNMKNTHSRYEEKSVAGMANLVGEILAGPKANRLRKNLCQGLSSTGENSLHC